MSVTILHGRREGQERTNSFLPKVGLLAQGINPKEVAVLQARDWQRIHDNYLRRNKEAEKHEAKARDRNTLHERSKDLVKHWDNTIEGQRLKKLQARKIREEQEEIERQKIDIEEAKLQAVKRKEAIERAKKLQYYQTDRVKGFHGALLLTEVLKERDAQIEMKNAKRDWQKEREQYLLEQNRKNLEASNRAEREREIEQFIKAKEMANFQFLQMKDKVDTMKKEREEDVEEGKQIKQQYEAFRKAHDQRKSEQRQFKSILMDTNKNEIFLKKEKQKLEKKEEDEEDEKTRKFVDAKRKMARMRKAKEQELFDAFQNHTEKMRSKLEEQMKQKVDDEDDRIAKTVAEREKKRLLEEEKKEKERKETLRQIKEHRKQMMENTERTAEENKLKDKALLMQRIETDNEFHKNMLEDKTNQRNKLNALLNFHKDQMVEKKQAAAHELEKQLADDAKNTELLVKEEETFQEYANKVINDAKAGKRNPFPLMKAAREGPGGGRGPKFEGNAGLRPSYIVADATGVQLPHYLKDNPTYTKTYGHVGKSGKRLGFTW